MSMKVSVCIAVYNGSRYLIPQLESILNQLKKDDELIVIDDYSSDSSTKIIENLDDPRIFLHTNTKNLGPQKTFERAIYLASGDVIFFSDQDDVWLPNKVAMFIEVFHHMRPSAVVSDASIIDENDFVLVESFFKYRNSGPGLVKNFVRNTYLGCCMAIDKRAKDWILPFPNGITQHDEWIGLVCDFMDRVIFLDQPLTLYRRHSSNTSSAKRLPILKVLKNRLNMLRAMSSRFPKLLLQRLRGTRF